MESLAKIEKTVLIKDIPEEELNTLILTHFITWLSNLLSLRNETSAERLEMALLAIKEHCKGMTIAEMKKMFELYADSKLSIKPISNYFDRILFGKIVEAYRQQKPVKKLENTKKELTEEEKNNLTIQGIVCCFDKFIQTGTIADGYVWVYNYLEKLGLFNYTTEQKLAQMKIATDRLLQEAKESLNRQEYKALQFRIANNLKNSAVIVKSKKMLLERFFSTLKTKNKHIKEFL